MTTVSGNNYTYLGSDLVNCIGGLVQRSGITSNSSDTLPTATDIITSFTGANSSSNIGQSFSFAIFNNSAFNITLSQNTGLTFVGTTSDDILPQGVRTYTVIQTAISTAVIYIVGNSPLNPDISNSLYLTNNMVFVGNSSNIAIGVAMSGDATIDNSGLMTVTGINGTSISPGSSFLLNRMLNRPVTTTIVNTSTATAAQWVYGVIDSNAAATFNLTTPSAANIVSYIPSATVGMTFETIINNVATAARTITIVNGTGVSRSNNIVIQTVDANPITGRYFITLITRITSVTPGSEAVIMYPA